MSFVCVCAFFSKVWVSPQKFPCADFSTHQAAEYSTKTPLTRQDAEELRWLSKFDSWKPAPLKTPWQDGVFFQIISNIVFFMHLSDRCLDTASFKPPLKTTKIDRMSGYQSPPNWGKSPHINSTKWLWIKSRVTLETLNPKFSKMFHYQGGGFKYFLIFNPTWGRFPNWRAYFSVGWVETTNQLFFSRKSTDLGSLKWRSLDWPLCGKTIPGMHGFSPWLNHACSCGKKCFFIYNSLLKWSFFQEICSSSIVVNA